MVGDRSLNPHFFTYGGLHHYIVSVGAVIPAKLYGKIFDPLPKEGDWAQREERQSRQLIIMGILSRSISAVLSALLVGLTFYICSLLFNDPSVGLLAASFLCVSMSFVAIAHFATVDAAANFWFWLSCLLALLAWTREKDSAFLFASFVAGLAIGTKTDRAMVLFPLAFIYFFSHRQLKSYGKIAASLFLILFGWVLANPSLILSPFEFMDGFTRDHFYNAMRSDWWSSNPRLAVFDYMRGGLGTPLFLLAILTGIYGGYRIWILRGWKTAVWLLSTFVPVLAVYMLNFVLPWYVPFLYPPIMILTAFGCMDVIRRTVGGFRMLIILVVASVWLMAFFHTGELLGQFANDTRYRAAEWIERHVPPQTRIEMIGRGPYLPPWKYTVSKPSSVHTIQFHYPPLQRLSNNTTYQSIRRFILGLERWAGDNFNYPVRTKPFEGWFDDIPIILSGQIVNGHLRNGKEPEVEPDYIVVIGDARTLNNRPGYRLSVEFPAPPALVNFVDPGVRIFQKENP